MAKKWILSSLAAVAVAVGIVACGGGGGTPQTGDSGGGGLGLIPDPTLGGVTAIGAPLSGATITLIDSRGLSFTTTADADGKYTFAKADIAAATPPFLITASTNLGDSQISHYTIVTSKSAGGWANVTPLTTAVAALASPTTIPSAMTKEQLAAIATSDVTSATAKVKAVIQPLSNALNIPSSFDPTTDSTFVANRTGADLLLDHIGVAVRTSGVNITNKMAVVTEDAASTSSVSVPKAGTTTSQLPSDNTNTSGFDALAAKFQKCFKVASTLRLSNKTTSGATLHADCTGIAAPDYLHNGTPFMNRWATQLNSSAMDNATFSAPVVRLRLQQSGNGVREKISVNFNFKDSSGAGYTRPETIEKQADGSWLLVGNKRDYNFFSESALTYYDDVSTLAFNNTNNSRVDAGLRLSVDPRAYIDSTGKGTNAALDMTTSSGSKEGTAGKFVTLAASVPTGSKTVGCVVVKGPGAMVGQQWQGFHPNGILLKRPDASTVQDYLAIDSIVTDGARSAITAATAAAAGNFGAGQTVSFSYNGATISNICTYNFGNRAGTSTTLTDTANPTVWETTQSSNTYVVEMKALGPRKNVLTGVANDATIQGRNLAWYTGPRYARDSTPSDALVKQFDNNPNITFEVFDTDGKLRAVINSRYLGELPPAEMAKLYFEANRVSKFDSATLKRYLNYADATATVTDSPTTVTANWTTSADAWGADRINLYSEVQRSEVGTGIANVTTSPTKVNGLWTSDAATANELNVISGTNFYWWNAGFAKPTGTTACTGSSLISTTGVSVSRSTLSLTGSTIDSPYYGSTQLTNACIAASGSATTKAYLLRELATRTYTDSNVRLYAYTSNKLLRN